MDFDGDGILDLVSGSYDPGEFYLFRGKGKGEFHARETIKDKNAKQAVVKLTYFSPESCSEARGFLRSLFKWSISRLIWFLTNC